MSEVKVLKFGGTSVKTIGRILHVAKIISERAQRSKLIVVVSAMGDTTDYLLGLANHCSSKPDRRELDVLLSTGEQQSIALLSLVLCDMGIKARSFTGPQVGIRTDHNHNDARIVEIDALRLQALLKENDVLVVAGFQGASPDGDITTLGRGGSDTTAVALAAACRACECDIYTDVDGVYTDDPNKVRSARLLPTVSYDQMLAMARQGAQVLHPRAVELAKEHRVKLRVRSTFNCDHDGTLIAEVNVPVAQRTLVLSA